MAEYEIQSLQEAVQNLRDAFNDVIDVCKQDIAGIDPCLAEEVERAKQQIIGQIIEAHPYADPGTFIELADGRWTTLQNPRKNPRHLSNYRMAGGPPVRM